MVLIRIKCGIVFVSLAVYVLVRYFKIYRRHCRNSGRLANPIFPKVYYDKILWRKLFDHEKIFVDMTDKLKARNIALARSKDLKTTEIIWEGERIEDFPLETIEKPCIVKFNTGSGWYFVVEDASEETRRRLTEKMQHFARQPHYGPKSGEWSYLGIEKRLFAERLLLDETGKPADDYKFFFCCGEMVQMSVSHDRWGDRALVRYDAELRPMSIDREGWRRDHEPADWHMIERVMRVARDLAGDMDFIRVDVYVHKDEIYFGEFTLYPASGDKNDPRVAAGRGDKWDIRRSHFFRGELNFFKRAYLDCLNFRYRDTISTFPTREKATV